MAEKKRVIFTKPKHREKNMNELSAEALALAYQTGIRQLGPLVQRIIELEKKVAALQANQPNA